MVLDAGSVLVYIVGLFLLYLCCWVFRRPLWWLFRLFLSCVAGAAALWAFNLLAGRLGLHLALNPLTAMITGVLGAPGVALALLLQGIL